MAELRLTGRPASPGFAEGHPFRLPDRQTAQHTKGSPLEEAQALRKAIAASISHLSDLVTGLESDAAEMIGFQIAMLEDDALAEQAFIDIDAGHSALDAWFNAIEAELQNYRNAEDEYFRARSADLEDMRELVTERLSGFASLSIPEGAIIFARDFLPSRFLSVDWSKGGAILLSEGSSTSHVAMLARTRGVPMIVGLGEIPQTDATVIVDGGLGEAIISPDQTTRSAYRERISRAEADAMAAANVANRPAITRDGVPVSIYINIADPAELDQIDKTLCDGIGLVRTEFLFGAGPDLPDEETQYKIYRRILEWADGRPVTIRTLDAGGDKPIAGLTQDGESNPFLGIRGLRLSLARPDVFRVQLRALARAAKHGVLKVMAPMVTAPDEYSEFTRLMDDEVASLRQAGIYVDRPALGMMVEVPAAAIAIDCFDADFFSIGSNDLTQYVTAAGRDNGAVADLADPSHPAMLRLFKSLSEYGIVSGREVSICGDAAGDMVHIPNLLSSGLRTLSVAPTLVGRVKLAISRLNSGDREASS